MKLMSQAIKRGILQSFDPSTYTASVLILEATSAFLTGVPVATHIDGTSAQSGAYCAVLFFDEQNSDDAVVLAMYPNGSQGVPNPAPGRLVMVTPVQQLNATIIPNNTTQTFAMGTNIPAGALAVVFKAYFTSSATATYIQIAPHGGDITAHAVVGNLSVANGYLDGVGIVQVDASGQVDIKASGGACTVTLYTYGYSM
jgi:hypothetical protein